MTRFVFLKIFLTSSSTLTAVGLCLVKGSWSSQKLWSWWQPCLVYISCYHCYLIGVYEASQSQQVWLFSIKNFFRMWPVVKSFFYLVHRSLPSALMTIATAFHIHRISHSWFITYCTWLFHFSDIYYYVINKSEKFVT